MDETHDPAPGLLIAQARQRDAAAFSTLMRPLIPQLVARAAAILGTESEAADAVQETLTRAWSGLPGLRDPETYEAWLGRILQNQCRDALRRRARSSVREIHVVGPFPDPSGPGDFADDVSARQVFERAFERLDAEPRALLVLHHLEHRPLRDIALALGIPEGTAKSRLSAARRSLELALERELR